MIEEITVQYDICEADDMEVWFIYTDGALYKVAYSKTEVLTAIAAILRKEIEK